MKKTVDILGYVGMVLVVGSFLFNPAGNIFLAVNLSGAIITAIYSVFIKSKPVLIMNVCIGIFDILHLSGIHISDLLSQ